MHLLCGVFFVVVFPNISAVHFFLLFACLFVFLNKREIRLGEGKKIRKIRSKIHERRGLDVSCPVGVWGKSSVMLAT